MNGAEQIVYQLEQLNVKHVFGYPGGAVLPLYDALYDNKSIKHIRLTHEQHVVHAADGYARASGKVGVAMVTSGPGATNAITGIATAYMDSVPMVIISGQVPSTFLGRDSFQEIDITGVATPVTKHTYLVSKVEDLAQAFYEAFHIASSGRKGPVLIDITKDVLTALCQPMTIMKIEGDRPVYPSMSDDKLKRILKLIGESKKPVIYAGGGMVTGDASDLLENFAKKIDSPVVNTLMGLGSFDRKSDLSLGMVGMHGSHKANMALTDADLIIALGVRFSDRVAVNKEQFTQNAKIIRIDLDPTEVDKNFKEDYSIQMDVKDALEFLIDSVLKMDHKPWLDLIHDDKVKDKNSISEYLELMADYLPLNTKVVTDVGQHQMWTAQQYPFNHSRQWITSGGLGTMGFGTGAAIGAALATDGPVLLVTGDGSLQMSMMEFLSINALDLEIKILLINNTCLGMVRQWQSFFYKDRFSETCFDGSIKFCSIASSMGISSSSVNSGQGLKELLKTGLDKNHLIEVKLARMDDVLPFVPPGKSLRDMIL